MCKLLYAPSCSKSAVSSLPLSRRLQLLKATCLLHLLGTWQLHSLPSVVSWKEASVNFGDTGGGHQCQPKVGAVHCRSGKGA